MTPFRCAVLWLPSPNCLGQSTVPCLQIAHVNDHVTLNQKVDDPSISRHAVEDPTCPMFSRLPRSNIITSNCSRRDAERKGLVDHRLCTIRIRRGVKLVPGNLRFSICQLHESSHFYFGIAGGLLHYCLTKALQRRDR
jgi:hypothetical protein